MDRVGRQPALCPPGFWWTGHARFRPVRDRNNCRSGLGEAGFGRFFA